jgi:hypothetical protein
MEVLVSVTVLTILILAFGQVLASAQKLVNYSLAAARANAAANAIQFAIRQDLTSLSQGGFLRIEDNGNNDRIYFAAAGVSHSVAGGVTGENDAMGAVVGYGTCTAEGLDAGVPGNILWRGNWMLNNRTASAAADFAPWEFSDLWTNTGDLDAAIAAFPNNSVYAPDSLTSPPTTPAQMQLLWKYLALGCTEFNVDWSDGSGWAPPGTYTWKRTNTNLDTTSTYAWPAAIRFRMKLGGGDIDEEFGGDLIYEIIVPTALY